MRPLFLVLLAGLALGASPAFSGPALARQDAPLVQVETWPLLETGAIGSAIYLQDRAASRATDALLARFGGQAPDGLIGWVVEPQGDGQQVRFLVGSDGAPRSAK